MRWRGNRHKGVREAVVLHPIGFAFRSFSNQKSKALKAMLLLLRNPQKVSSRLTLRHSAYAISLTSSHHVGILSSHLLMRSMSAAPQGMYFEGDHIQINCVKHIAKLFYFIFIFCCLSVTVLN